jgi:hypothetical protein
MKSDLSQILETLRKIPGLSVSLRGTGSAVFLFIKSDRRASEVFLDGNRIIIECWDSADEEADDSPVSKEWFDSPEAAVQAVKRWFA